jgi:hypothetical protein
MRNTFNCSKPKSVSTTRMFASFIKPDWMGVFRKGILSNHDKGYLLTMKKASASTANTTKATKADHRSVTLLEPRYPSARL